MGAKEDQFLPLILVDESQIRPCRRNLQHVNKRLESLSRSDYHDYKGEGRERGVMNADTWTVAQAKAKFSEVIDKAQSEGPQTITRNGRTTAVIVAAEEWERKTKRKGNLAQFFAASPLRGSGVQIKRLRGRLRKAVQ